VGYHDYEWDITIVSGISRSWVGYRDREWDITIVSGISRSWDIMILEGDYQMMVYKQPFRHQKHRKKNWNGC